MFFFLIRHRDRSRSKHSEVLKGHIYIHLRKPRVLSPLRSLVRNEVDFMSTLGFWMIFINISNFLMFVRVGVGIKHSLPHLSESATETKVEVNFTSIMHLLYIYARMKEINFYQTIQV